MASTSVNGAHPPYAREALATLTSATALTAATYNTATADTDVYNRISQTRRPVEALIEVKGFPINWTIDGTAPTATAGTDVGFYSAAGDFITLQGYKAISSFQAINAVASSGAKIEVVYFR